MKSKWELTTLTTKIKAVFVKRKDIIALLTAEGFKIPDDADVSIYVPGAVIGQTWTLMWIMTTK